TTEGVDIGTGEAGVDIGPRTAGLFAERLGCGRMLVLDGPVGRLEVEGFSPGPRASAARVCPSTGMTIGWGGHAVGAAGERGLGGCGGEDGPRRAHDARLHRRRRGARVPFRHPAAGGDGAGRRAMTGRRRLIVGNWKMNLTEAWSLRLLDDLLPRLAALDLAT